MNPNKKITIVHCGPCYGHIRPSLAHHNPATSAAVARSRSLRGEGVRLPAKLLQRGEKKGVGIENFYFHHFLEEINCFVVISNISMDLGAISALQFMV